VQTLGVSIERQAKANESVPKPILVVYRREARVDAIDEYSRRLVNALCSSGVSARYIADGLSSALRQVSDYGSILLQYNPFSYGHWGVAPGLVRDAIGLRRQAGVSLAVSVHEAWVDTDDPARARWRSMLMGTYQRIQLVALLEMADVVIVATQPLARKLGRPNAIHVPVGSNITPVPITREDARGRLGVCDELVVSLFGTSHPSRALEYATAAIALLAEEKGKGTVKVLNLGLGAPQLRLATGIAVYTPGHLEAEELSLRLRASDILLLPFTDGLSTRRTTLMAGLAHGVAVVGLYGAGTDDVLSRSPEAITLTPVGDIGAFTNAVLQLAGDPLRLRSAGSSGQDLYARHFDWPIAADRIRSALTGTSRDWHTATQP